MGNTEFIAILEFPEEKMRVLKIPENFCPSTYYDVISPSSGLVKLIIRKSVAKNHRNPEHSNSECGLYPYSRSFERQTDRLSGHELRLIQPSDKKIRRNGKTYRV